MAEKTKKPKTTKKADKKEVTAKQPTKIVAVIDRSGSMESVKDDAIGGFNTFLEEQKKLPDKATFTLIEFNHGTQVKYSDVDISEVKPYTIDTYRPEGMTALYDAVGKGIGEATRKGDAHKVIVVILTDGHENSSHEVTKEAVSKMIEQHTAEGWAFIFLGVGFSQFDAETIAKSMSINADMAMGTSRADIGTKAFSSMSNATASYRSSNSVNSNWRKR